MRRFNQNDRRKERIRQLYCETCNALVVLFHGVVDISLVISDQRLLPVSDS
jgi:hypothetical protein